MASPTQRVQTAKGLGTPELPLSLLPLTENHVPSACFVGPVGLAINRGHPCPLSFHSGLLLEPSDFFRTTSGQSMSSWLGRFLWRWLKAMRKLGTKLGEWGVPSPVTWFSVELC